MSCINEDMKIFEQIKQSFGEAKQLINEMLNKYENEEGKITTSPLVCTLLSQLPDFKKDEKELDYNDFNQKTAQYGYYNKLIIFKDYFAREDYLKFESI